jgi:hypothetical protein
MFEALRNSSIVGLLSLVVPILPLGAGIAYALGPTEQRLALMRPVSLAAIFAGLCGSLVGTVNILRHIGVSATPVSSQAIAVGSAEALVPLLFGFGCLTAAWLCVAIGLRRRP